MKSVQAKAQAIKLLKVDEKDILEKECSVGWIFYSLKKPSKKDSYCLVSQFTDKATLHQSGLSDEDLIREHLESY